MTFRKKLCKWGGPCPSTARWITPNSAMFRLQASGASLKCTKASSSETLSCRRNRGRMASNGASTDGAAWAIPGVRYSI
eukprot:11871887-Karenia_brevis.AAC.1